MKRSIVSLTLLLTSFIAYAAGDPVLTVYKDPSCGCCTKWVDYMRRSGFDVKVVETRDSASVKQRFSVPDRLAACHTAVLEGSGQVIEGHVPATAVRKLIPHPELKGVAVPGMPGNSPGMGQMDGNLVTVDFSGKPFSRD
jgi:hypothetical protein